MARLRHALVTGAGRGLGLALVRLLLARGDRVVATCRVPGRANALNQLTGEYPGRLHVLPLDVAAAASHAALARELPLVLGDGDDDGGGTTPRIDLLINNAGVLHSGERFGNVGAAFLEDSFRTNGLGPFLLVQALAPLLADGARIGNLSSQLGSLAGTTRFGTPSYCISKAAQNMATRLLAAALADRGMVVLALHPGWVRTEMGGESAPVAVDDAAAGLLRVLDGAAADASGGFVDWQGEPLPW